MKKSVGGGVLIVALLAVLAGGPGMAQVRTPEVAGQFYPADSTELERTVERFLEEAPQIPLEGEVVALLAPHAGYSYSGSVEGYSYRTLRGSSLNTVIILGAAHYFPTEEAALFDGEAYETPLGQVKVDQELIRELLKATPLFVVNKKAHQREHSVETQIPFLQKTLDSFQVVPIVIGISQLSTYRQIGEAMARVIQQQETRGKKVLIVASSDLSHYPNDEDARAVDSSTLQALLTMNPQSFSQVNAQWMGKGIRNLACTYCGEGALTTVMIAAKALGADRARLLRYANSSDVPFGEKGRVVGYASVVFLRGEENEPEAFAVSKETQERLLKMARSAIEKGIEAGKTPKSFDDTKGDATLDQTTALFVTLRKEGKLRGCIGGTEARLPLGEGVQYFACASAFEDPRFSPLTKEELSGVKIEISLLSPLKRAGSHVEIIPGVHGVVVRRGGRSGLFLPQVWLETGWTKEVFLDQLCSQKAGLASRAWQDPETELYLFTVFSFEEEGKVR